MMNTIQEKRIQEGDLEPEFSDISEELEVIIQPRVPTEELLAERVDNARSASLNSKAHLKGSKTRKNKKKKASIIDRVNKQSLRVEAIDLDTRYFQENLAVLSRMSHGTFTTLDKLLHKRPDYQKHLAIELEFEAAHIDRFNLANFATHVFAIAKQANPARKPIPRHFKTCFSIGVPPRGIDWFPPSAVFQTHNFIPDIARLTTQEEFIYLLDIFYELSWQAGNYMDALERFRCAYYRKAQNVGDGMEGDWIINKIAQYHFKPWTLFCFYRLLVQIGFEAGPIDTSWGDIYSEKLSHVDYAFIRNTLSFYQGGESVIDWQRHRGIEVVSQGCHIARLMDRRIFRLAINHFTRKLSFIKLVLTRMRLPSRWICVRNMSLSDWVAVSFYIMRKGKYVTPHSELGNLMAGLDTYEYTICAEELYVDNKIVLPYLSSRNRPGEMTLNGVGLFHIEALAVRGSYIVSPFRYITAWPLIPWRYRHHYENVDYIRYKDHKRLLGMLQRVQFTTPYEVSQADYYSPIVVRTENPDGTFNYGHYSPFFARENCIRPYSDTMYVTSGVQHVIGTSKDRDVPAEERDEDEILLANAEREELPPYLQQMWDRIRAIVTTIVSDSIKDLASTLVQSVIDMFKAGLAKIKSMFASIFEFVKSMFDRIKDCLYSFIVSWGVYDPDDVFKFEMADILVIILSLALFHQTENVFLKAAYISGLMVHFKVGNRCVTLFQKVVELWSSDRDEENSEAKKVYGTCLITNITHVFDHYAEPGCMLLAAALLSVCGYAATMNDRRHVTEKVVECFKNIHFSAMGVAGILKLLDSIKALVNWIYDYVKRKLSPEDSPPDEAALKIERDRFVKEGLSFVLKTDLFSTDAGLCTIKQSPKYQQHIIDMQRQALSLRTALLSPLALRKDIDPGFKSALRESITAHKKLFNAVHRACKFGGMRFTPTHVQFVGEPGHGKTTCLHLISKRIRDRCYTGQNMSNVSWARGLGDFFDGYNGQKIAIFDDIWKVIDATMVAEIIALVSNTPLVVPMAHLEDKGVYFTSEWILSTSNVEYPHVNEIFCNKAVHRRRHLLIKTVCDDRVLNKVTSKFDYDLFKQFYPDVSQEEMVRTMPHMRFSFLKPVLDKNTTDEYEHGTITDDEFQAMCHFTEDEVLPAGLTMPLKDLTYTVMLEKMFARFEALHEEEQIIKDSVGVIDIKDAKEDLTVISKMIELHGKERVGKIFDSVDVGDLDIDVMLEAPGPSADPGEIAQVESQIDLWIEDLEDYMVELNTTKFKVQDFSKWRAARKTPTGTSKERDEEYRDCLEAGTSEEQPEEEDAMISYRGKYLESRKKKLSALSNYDHLRMFPFKTVGDETQVAINCRYLPTVDTSGVINTFDLTEFKLTELEKAQFPTVAAAIAYTSHNLKLIFVKQMRCDKYANIWIKWCPEFDFVLNYYSSAMSKEQLRLNRWQRLSICPGFVECMDSMVCAGRTSIERMSLIAQYRWKRMEPIRELVNETDCIFKSYFMRMCDTLNKGFRYFLNVRMNYGVLLLGYVTYCGIKAGISSIYEFFNPVCEGTSRLYFKRSAIRAPAPRKAIGHVQGTHDSVFFPVAPQLIEDELRAVQRNLVLCRVRYEKLEGGHSELIFNAVGIYGHCMIANYHSVYPFLDKREPFLLEYRPTNAAGEFWQIYVEPEKHLYLYPDTDVIMIHCPDMRSFRDIRSHFLLDQDYRISDIGTNVYHTYVDMKLQIHTSALPFSRVVNDQTFQIHSEKGTCNQLVKNTRVLVLQGLSIVGSSGGPVLDIIPDRRRTVLGIQSFNSRNNSYVTVVTQEMLQAGIDSFARTNYHHEIPDYIKVHGTSATVELFKSHVDVVGTVPPSHVLGIVEKTSIIKSPFHKIFPSKKIPAILSAFDPRIAPNVHPLGHSINKFSRDVMQPLEPRRLQKATTDIAAYIRSFVGDGKLQWRDYTTAITGDAMLQQTHVALSTSPGIPWVWSNKAPGKSGKRMWISYDEDEQTWLIDRCVLDRCAEVEESLARGVVPPLVMFEFPKDEIRPEDKVLFPKTRSISVLNMVHSILWRACSLDLDSYLHKVAGRAPTAVGINVDSLRWQELYERLQSFNSVGCDFDVGNWDGHMPPELFRAAVSITSILYKDTERQRMIRFGLAEHAMFGITQFLDIAHFKFRGVPSGFAGTTSINTIGHLLLIYYFWLEINKDTEYATLTYFTKYLGLAIYSDDVIMVMSPDCWFRPSKIIQLYQQYGWPITSAAKDCKEPDKERPVDELQLLKRKFVADHLIGKAWIHAQIDIETIYDLLCWYSPKSRPITQLYSNIADALEFAVAHGPEVYNEIHNLVNICLADLNLQPYYVPYEDMRAIMYARLRDLQKLRALPNQEELVKKSLSVNSDRYMWKEM